MKRTRRVQPDAQTIEKLQQEARNAADAYFRAANAHNAAIQEAITQEWKLNADGKQSLHATAQLERHALRRYSRSVTALKDAFPPVPNPAKRRNTSSSNLKGKPLSPREKEILKLIADGLSSREIADQLEISFKTAVAHRYHIMEKLQIHDVVTLVRYALRNKLIAP